MTAPAHLDVAVSGGSLRVARWGTGDHVVLAPHGITANHVSWSLVAERLDPSVTLLAPDLRGRGDSGTLPGPYSMAAHADDLVAVLDHLGIDDAVIAGHSMGGFVAVKTALRHADRVTSLVLIDGGLALPVPPGLEIDAILTAVIGPAMDRLEKSFESREAYHGYWRDHPALSAAWNPTIEAYLDHDIHEVEDAWVSKVSAEAVRGDGRDTLVDTSLARDFASIEVPMHFLWAPRGIMDADPLYPRAIVTQFEESVANLTVTELDDVNHYTLALAPEGAAQVAAAIHDAVGVA